MRIKFIIPLIFFFGILLFQSSCTYYSEEELYPTCDTLSVGYAADINPIISSNCLGCHNAIDQEGGIVLEEHSGVEAIALNGLLVCVTTRNPDCFEMPPSYSLGQCEIEKIKIWVNEGALDN